MTGGPQGGPTAAMLAYVDDCMRPPERQAFEARMAAEPKIRHQVDLWLAQDEAIRVAFSDPQQRGAAGERPEGKGSKAPLPVRDLRHPATAAKPASGPGPNSFRARVLAAKDEIVPARGRLARPLRAFRLAAAVFALWAAGALIVSSDRSAAVRASTAAYRIYAETSAHPVEIATAEPAALDRWLAPQIGHPVPIPDLAAAGWDLLGGRVVPGARAAASFLVYQTAQRERIGLEVEALDSPPASDIETIESGDLVAASWTEAGQAFTLVGRASSARLSEMARLVRAEGGKP